MKRVILGIIFFLTPLQLWAAESEYQITDICRATLNDMLHRDLETMKATLLNDGSARVQYVRPNDGKSFSYRCRSIDGVSIGILHEDITEPRWYGEEPEDVQRSYRIINGKLIIRTITNISKTVSEEVYSHVEFPVGPKIENNKSAFLESYGTKIAESFAGKKLKLGKAYQVITKPLNSYRIDFETSAKDLLSQSGGGDDDAIYSANQIKNESWHQAFCTQELKKFMASNHIDMISGFISNKGENELISPCLN
ncbi:hypothetical protein Q3V30_22180 (plasmid) [Erwinia pyri]|uniref:DUF1849 family protein n=1 Tax=Erwinia pyri TaxID=3062598 RepID=A0AA50DS51_9GAMM|nr:hypothetical protein [Erwinia sp. DE2]WLS81166.1 hypothetical protein Q3V30_22180 [Erwinia sp. DE2]